MTGAKGDHRGRLVYSRVLAALSLICGCTSAMLGQTPMPVVASAGALHALSAAEAKRSLPVRFRAVVTFYDAQSFSLFVSDATGGVYVSVPWEKIPPWREGTLVEVTGVTWPGDFAPIVGLGSLRVLGQSRGLLPAPRASVIELSAGLHDSDRVEIAGLVRSVSIVGHMVSLKVLTHDGPILALMPSQPGERYDRLIDATVRVRGVAGVEFNRHLQMTGSHLLVSSLADVRVLRSNGSDPFALPVRTVSQLARFDRNADLTARVHLRGRVALHWPGRLLCLQDATGGLCVETRILEAYPLGSMVDLVGYPVYASQTPALADARVRSTLTSAVPPLLARRVSSKGVMEGDDSAQLVSLEGELVGLSSEARAWQLTIASEGVVFTAALPKDSGPSTMSGWKVGSYVRVAGVCANEVDTRVGMDWGTHQKLVSFRLMMRSADDVKVLRTPTWWTPEHTFNTLALGVLGMLAIFCWVVMLRRQVEQRTRELRDSERRFRHLAHHDSLTGVPNRAWFQERAERALALSGRSGECVGLLLLDLDHFKPVNDTLGHDAGDAMLCALAQRVAGAIRRVDTLARLGGDEFAVVLVDLADAQDAEQVAQKILEAICKPVEIKGRSVGMSASIGVAVFPEDGESVTELLRSADLAMYQSKKHLRGGVRRYRREVTLREIEDAEAEASTAVVGFG